MNNSNLITETFSRIDANGNPNWNCKNGILLLGYNIIMVENFLECNYG